MPSTRRLPAVVPCCSLLAGVWLSTTLCVSAQETLALCVWAALALATSKRRLALAAACAALFCAGALLDQHDRARARARTTGCLQGGEALEAEVVGTVVGIPERDAEGQRWFDMQARRHPCGSDPSGLSLRIRVAKSLPEPAGVVDALAAGDRVRLWCRLKRPQGYWNPGSPDPAETLRVAGLDAYGSVKSARLVELLDRGRPGLRRGADALKRFARRRLDRALSPTGAPRALAGAMLLGDRRALDEATRRRLRDSGLVHLVAISGLHVGWLTVLAVGGLRRGRLNLFLILVLCAALLSIFVQLVGARPSVLRAAVAAATVLLARSIGRDGRPLNTLALIAAGLVALEPAILRDTGFQLSFAATAGILRLSRPILKSAGAAGPAPSAAVMSLTAYLATSPLVALHLGRQAPVGLLANLLGVPMAGVLLLSGYATIALAGAPGLDGLSTACARGSAVALIRLAEIGASLPGGAFAVAPPAGTTLAVYYALLAAPTGTIARSRSSWARLIARGRVTALALVSVGVHLGPPAPLPETLEVSVIDVGQGQAVAVHGPAGRGLLIDAGGAYGGGAPDPGERVVVPYLLRSGVRRLDALILSHGDLDHAGGAAAVLRDLEVAELWIGPRAITHPRMRDIAALARRRGGTVVLAEQGRRGEPAGIPARILSPGREWASRRGNDDSVAVLLGTAPNRVLVPGDLEAAGEAALLAGSASVFAEALVLTHHGSKTGTGSAFLSRVSPTFAVVSAGRHNRFGHPHAEVLRRLARSGVPLWRTDVHGAVRLLAGPDGWRVQTVAHRRTGSSADDERNRDERAEEHDQ